jgi:hypothetical protein
MKRIAVTTLAGVMSLAVTLGGSYALFNTSVDVGQIDPIDTGRIKMSFDYSLDESNGGNGHKYFFVKSTISSLDLNVSGDSQEKFNANLSTAIADYKKSETPPSSLPVLGGHSLVSENTLKTDDVAVLALLVKNESSRAAYVRFKAPIDMDDDDTTLNNISKAAYYITMRELDSTPATTEPTTLEGKLQEEVDRSVVFSGSPLTYSVRRESNPDPEPKKEQDWFYVTNPLRPTVDGKPDYYLILVHALIVDATSGCLKFVAPEIEAIQADTIMEGPNEFDDDKGSFPRLALWDAWREDAVTSAGSIIFLEPTDDDNYLSTPPPE